LIFLCVCSLSDLWYLIKMQLSMKYRHSQWQILVGCFQRNLSTSLLMGSCFCNELQPLKILIEYCLVRRFCTNFFRKFTKYTITIGNENNLSIYLKEGGRIWCEIVAPFVKDSISSLLAPSGFTVTLSAFLVKSNG
jgi:hypothetical protein